MVVWAELVEHMVASVDPAGSIPRVYSAQDQRLELDLGPEWILELDSAQVQGLELDLVPELIL